MHHLDLVAIELVRKLRPRRFLAQLDAENVAIRVIRDCLDERRFPTPRRTLHQNPQSLGNTVPLLPRPIFNKEIHALSHHIHRIPLNVRQRLVRLKWELPEHHMLRRRLVANPPIQPPRERKRHIFKLLQLVPQLVCVVNLPPPAQLVQITPRPIQRMLL